MRTILCQCCERNSTHLTSIHVTFRHGVPICPPLVAHSPFKKEFAAWLLTHSMDPQTVLHQGHLLLATNVAMKLALYWCGRWLCSGASAGLFWCCMCIHRLSRLWPRSLHVCTSAGRIGPCGATTAGATYPGGGQAAVKCWARNLPRLRMLVVAPSPLICKQFF